MATGIPANGSSSPESPTPPASGVLGQLSANIRAKHDGRGGVRPGAGRPKGVPNKVTDKNSGNGVSPDSPEPKTTLPPVDRKFIEEAAKTALKALDGIITRRVYSATCSIWPGHPDVEKNAKKFESDIALTESEIKLFSDTMGTIAEKYPRLFGYAPELTLGIFVVGYGARVMSTFAEIKKLNVEVSTLRAQHAQASPETTGAAPPANGNAVAPQAN
jgi:hypothetical protein